MHACSEICWWFVACLLCHADADNLQLDNNTTWDGVEVVSAAEQVLKSKFKPLLKVPLEFTVRQVCRSDDGDKTMRRNVKNSVHALTKALMLDSESAAIFAERLTAKLSTSIGRVCAHYTKATLAHVVYTHAMLLARRWAALQPPTDAQTADGRKEVLLQQAQQVVGEALVAELLEATNVSV